MTFSFDPNVGLIVVAGELRGPLDTVELRFLVDTGADMTVITPGSMAAAGFDLTRPLDQIGVTTAGASDMSAGVFRVARFSALGVNRDNFPVLCYGLPPNLTFDGLLGLDFFEGCVLTLDLVNHTVSVN